ncbi:NUDIX domain-containing protein [Paenibacillaceae bacterium GAS479]|nr:NUDIX domain-containing protein [Paenibacillaceae bacterium GAS479]
MGYILDLRQIVGSRPLIMAGACMIVVNKQNEILLQLREDNGLWGLLGGSLEPGESMEEVARRELFEETGLHAGNITLFNVFSGKELYYQYPHGDEVYNVVAAYICHEYKISPPDKPIIDNYLKMFGESSLRKKSMMEQCWLTPLIQVKSN